MLWKSMGWCFIMSSCKWDWGWCQSFHVAPDTWHLNLTHSLWLADMKAHSINESFLWHLTHDTWRRIESRIVCNSMFFATRHTPHGRIFQHVQLKVRLRMWQWHLTIEAYLLTFSYTRGMMHITMWKILSSCPAVNKAEDEAILRHLTHDTWRRIESRIICKCYERATMHIMPSCK